MNAQTIETRTTYQATTTEYKLPDLNEGPSEKLMIGNLRIIDQAFFSADSIEDIDDEMRYSVREILWEVQEQLEKFSEYRQMVDTILVPTHKSLKNIGSMGRVIIEMLEDMDHDDLIKNKIFLELMEIEKKREEGAKKLTE